VYGNSLFIRDKESVRTEQKMPVSKNDGGRYEMKRKKE